MLSFRFRRRPVAQAAPGPCFHCGLPLPVPVADWVAFDGTRRPVCCAACAAVAQMVIGAGQGAYYREKWHLGAGSHDQLPA